MATSLWAKFTNLVYYRKRLRFLSRGLLV